MVRISGWRGGRSERMSRGPAEEFPEEKDLVIDAVLPIGLIVAAGTFDIVVIDLEI
jgi:hypothetical protein